MKSSYFKLVAIALVLAVVAAIAVSQTVKRAHMHSYGMFAGDAYSGGMFGDHMLRFFTRKLDLTDAQQAQVMANRRLREAQRLAEAGDVSLPVREDHQ